MSRLPFWQTLVVVVVAYSLVGAWVNTQSPTVEAANAHWPWISVVVAATSGTVILWATWARTATDPHELWPIITIGVSLLWIALWVARSFLMDPAVDPLIQSMTLRPAFTALYALMAGIVLARKPT